MDRLSSHLESSEVNTSSAEDPVIGFGGGEEHLIRARAESPSIDHRLYELNELEISYDPEDEALWTFMCPRGRPSFTPPMLHDFLEWQRLINENFGPGQVPIKYLILGSRAPGVFCFGGDLQLFEHLIRTGDRDGLARYGYRCVEILHRNMNALDLPMLTIGLVQGAALGGGFEALLSFDYIVAEKGATFGLPEILFGLFPGMGAHSLLSRKLGSAMADRLIVSNQTYSAEEMYQLGIVHHLAENGEGLAVCREFIRKSARRHAGLVNARRAMKVTNPLSLSELKRVVDLWADTALQLSDGDLKVMNRLTRAQERVAQKV